MMQKIQLFILVTFLSFLTSCRDSEYLFFEEPAPEIEEDARLYTFDQYLGSTAIDILFVIDNSGSMATIQRNVATNARVFMEQFALTNFLDWKIGIISTDRGEDPYLGFKEPFGASLLASGDPEDFDRVIDTFSSTVTDLGINGSFEEYTFFNIDRVITQWSGLSNNRSFLRSDSHLVVVMITDEPEQSYLIDEDLYKVDNFINTLIGKLAASKVLRFYGAFDFGDLASCSGGTRYSGSTFEAIINATNGFAISACVDNFGVELARIGEDIRTLVNIPRIPLRNRPVANTIEVTYKGEILPPGRPEIGGVWYYDYNTNTINFYNVDFIEDIETDQIFIDFDVDDGVDRD